MTAFVRVVETGSFAQAANRLDVSVSAVSRQVAELEAQLGARLLNRSTRRLSLTESGQAYYERCIQLLADLDEAEQAVGAASVVPHGTLRLTASISFGVRYLAAAIADFEARHPQLRFDIELSDRAVDLVDEGLDLAIRIGDIGSQTLIGRKLGVAQIICCASPSYLEQHSAPHVPDDLRRLHCLTYAYSSEGNVWRFNDAAGGTHEVRVMGHAHANNGAMLASLAVAGAGVTVAPDFVVADDVRAGRLVALLPDYTPPAININAAYPSRRHLSAKVRAFVDYLAERFARNPEWRLDAAQPMRRAAIKRTRL